MVYSAQRVSNIEEYLQHAITGQWRLHSVVVSKTRPNETMPELSEAVQWLVILQKYA
jgi:hypothetical protein